MFLILLLVLIFPELYGRRDGRAASLSTAAFPRPRPRADRVHRVRVQASLHSHSGERWGGPRLLRRLAPDQARQCGSAVAAESYGHCRGDVSWVGGHLWRTAANHDARKERARVWESSGQKVEGCGLQVSWIKYQNDVFLFDFILLKHISLKYRNNYKYAINKTLY